MSTEYPYPVKTSVLKGITSHKCIESKIHKQVIHDSATGSKQRNKKAQDGGGGAGGWPCVGGEGGGARPPGDKEEALSSAVRA